VIRWAFLKRVLAGAIFGLYIAHLLYFLNPQVSVTPGRLALVTIVYGLICGLLFGSFLWGLRALRVKLFGRPDSAGAWRAHGFGFVVFAAFVAATLYWMHLSLFRIGYLPIGAVRVLAKATNLITITAFALLLLWFGERYADRRTSRWIFIGGVLLIAVSAFFLYERRDSYRTEKENVVVANVGTVAGQRPLIVVAVRNLPYDWILTMTGEGSLPFFASAKEQAYFTRLEPFPTMNTRALWATLVTGKLPYRHGVTGRFSYRTPLNGRDPSDKFILLPSGVGFRVWGLIPPIERIAPPLPSGDALPFWAIFDRVSLRASVIDWPWVAQRQTAQPSRALSAALQQRFNGAGRAKSRIVDALSDDLTNVTRLEFALRASQPTLAVASLNGFEEAQRALHIFTNDLPPRSTTKGDALRAYAEQIDAMLAEIASAFPDHLLVVVAPSGPVAPSIPETAIAIARDFVQQDDPGADDGFVLIRGSGVAHAEKPSSAFPTDLVPTILYGAGLPVGRDMDGRVLTDAFTDELLRRNALSVVQTYEAKQLVVRRAGAS
jgi:hypothetical protein